LPEPDEDDELPEFELDEEFSFAKFITFGGINWMRLIIKI
jgi:hypothetical protein